MSDAPHHNTTFFGLTTFRGSKTRFGIKLPDRRSHMYLVGKTGTGKSTLLESMIKQDLAEGQGFALLDPHGDLVDRIRDYVPEDRKQDMIYFNVPERSGALGFNPLEQVAPAMRPLAASGMISVFRNFWLESWGPRLEHILRNALLVLLDCEGSTLADVLRLLDDNKFRQAAVSKTSNPQVRDFWLKEYEGYPQRFRAEAVAPVQNKVGAFLSDPVLRGILTQPKSAFRLRQVMDSGKILLVNLAKGRIGEDTASLLGALLVSRIGLAALTRATIPEEQRRDFFLYLDEFHSFTTLSLAQMLSELRKYRLALVLAHQYLTQLDPRLRDAILGNTGTIASFRIGPADAEILAKEFQPQISISDLINLPNYHFYLKLMIDGQVSRPFSAESFGPDFT